MFIGRYIGRDGAVKPLFKSSEGRRSRADNSRNYSDFIFPFGGYTCISKEL